MDDEAENDEDDDEEDVVLEEMDVGDDAPISVIISFSF